MPKSNYTASQFSIDDLADEMANCPSDIASIDGGDHQISIWIDAHGNRKVAVQGTGSGVTLITFS